MHSVGDTERGAIWYSCYLFESYFQMLKIGSEDFVIMKHIQHQTVVN